MGQVRHAAHRSDNSLLDPMIIGPVVCDMLVTKFQFHSMAGQVPQGNDIDRRLEAALSVLLHGLGGTGA